MAALTFLEIVNNAIAEAKVQLDPLTSLNFAAPPRTVMYNNFKRWVNVAYKELYNDRPEWHFRQERASFVVHPRLQLKGLVDSPMTVGMTLRGQTSGVTFEILNVYSFEDVEDDGTIPEHTVDVEFLDGTLPRNLIFRETFDVINPLTDLITVENFAYLKGFGRYDFRSDIPNLAQIDINSVRMHRLPGDALLHNENFGTASRPVVPILWEEWPLEYDLYPWSGEFPQYITETHQGNYELYPRPTVPMYVAFNYARKVVPLVLWNDVPAGIPDDYHDYLVWKAVEEFADFDNNPKLFSRAKKHVEKYYGYLDRDEKQKPRFETSRFDGHAGSTFFRRGF